MKKVLALTLIALLAFLLITVVVENDLVQPYGDAKMSEVSDKYINQSVTENASVKFDESKDLETGSANAVTSIVVEYRSFDTLGEVTVLFISALGVSLIIGSSGTFFKRSKSGFILKTGSRVILPLLIIVGFYVITHGHLSPGGGFQGSAMIASSILLMSLSDPDFFPEIKAFKLLEGFSGTMYIIIGLLGLVFSNYFLENFMNTGTVGELFSAGIIPIIYVFIGLKVGAELTSIITDFLKKEAQYD